MRKNLFVRYFSMCTIIILSSFIFLGSMFAFLMSRYIKEDRQIMLTKAVVKAADFTAFNYEDNYCKYIDYRMLSQYYKSIAESSDKCVFFTDINGKTLICSDSQYCAHIKNTLSQKIMNSIDTNGKYMEFGYFDGMYQQRFYTVGVAVVTSTNDTIGYVFSSISAKSTTDVLNKVVKLFLISTIVSILLSSIVVYVFTQMMSRPLRQMSAAAKSFGRGDFSTRIYCKNKDEVGELANSFNQMADSLSELESMRKNFIANVSHELKTPMTSIAGFVDGILDGTIEESHQKKYLELVSNEVKRLSRLVKSMLNVAKIESGETKLNLSSVNISKIIIESVFNFEHNINEKEIDVKGLDLIDNKYVIADEDLIHQVIYNLIDNAVKFCNKGGFIEFSVDQNDKTTFIRIKNSGEGIPKSDLSHIFDRFYKTDKSRGLDKNGVGLGLHIVKSIVKMHNGDIFVSSIEGEFTEFVIKLSSAKD